MTGPQRHFAVVIGAAALAAVTFAGASLRQGPPIASPGATSEPSTVQRGWFALRETTDADGQLAGVTLESVRLPGGSLQRVSFTLRHPLSAHDQRDRTPFVGSSDGDNVLVGYPDGVETHVLRVSLTTGVALEITLPGLIHDAAEFGDAVYFVQLDPVTMRETGVWESRSGATRRLAGVPEGHSDQAFVERLAISGDGAFLIARHCDTSCAVRVISIGPGSVTASLEQPLGDWAGVGDAYFATRSWACKPVCAWAATDLSTMTSTSHQTPSGPAVVVATVAGDALMYGSTASAAAGINGVMLSTGALLPHAVPNKAGFSLVQQTDHQGFRLPPGQILLAADGLLVAPDGGAPLIAAILDVASGAVIDAPAAVEPTPH